MGDGDSHVTDTSSPTKRRCAEHTGLLLVPVFSQSCLYPATLASGQGVHVHAHEPLYPGRGMLLQKAIGYLFLRHNYVLVCVSVFVYLEGRPENIPSNNTLYIPLCPLSLDRKPDTQSSRSDIQQTSVYIVWRNFCSLAL